MPTPKRLKPSATRPAAKPAEKVLEDIEIQGRLRKDLKLTSQDIAEIDIELAIEAGLLSKPKRGRT